MIITELQQEFLNNFGYNFDVTSKFDLSKMFSRVDQQALYNNLICTEVSETISSLTKDEFDLIRRVNPFMKIRKAPTYFGQDRLAGSLIHFPKNVH